jgi:arabinofuranosyltransferase
MKKRFVFLLMITFVSISLLLSLWTYFQGKKTEEFSTVLQDFRSDFFEPSDKDALIDEIMAKKKRFVAYGTYIVVPPGEYTATFEIFSSSPETLHGQLQVSAERGRSVIASQDIQIEGFPASKVLAFKISVEKEIEPRLLYSSGNQEINLAEVKIHKVKSIFPWLKVMYTAILLAIGCTFIWMAVISAPQNNAAWKYYVAGFLFLAGCFLILWKAWISEDAFITIRHVDNFIRGYGPVFNITERVEGFTHPLWFAVLALFRWIGISPKGAAILPALLASFAALYILFFRIRIKTDTRKPAFLNPAAAILIGMSAFIDFGTSGLETGLSYLLLVLYAKFILENRWIHQPALTGLIASCLVLNRPDFGILLVLLFVSYLFKLAAKKVPLRCFVRFLFFPALLVGGYQIFRMGYYASLLPNPFYAKSGSGAYWSQGLKYVEDFAQGSLAPAILFLAVLMFFLNRNRDDLKNRTLVLFSGILHGFFVIRGGGDFMHGRFLLPALLLIALSVTGAFDRFFEKSHVFKIACIVTCLALFISSLAVTPVQKRGQPLHNNITDERFFYYKDNIIPLKHLFTDTMIMIWKTIGINYRNLAEKAKMPLRIAYKNVGFTGFYAGPRIYVCDELGLNDPVISRVVLTRRKRPGHEKNAPFGYLIMQKLTFRKTPFPLWNQLANTKYGILWDLSPKTLRRLDFMLDKNFKQKLDSQIVDYLDGLETGMIPDESEFLFFLKKVWLPYASKEHQQKFMLGYNQDLIDRFSESQKWIHENSDKVDSHLSRIQGPLEAKKFIENIGYALKTGLSLKYSPIGPVEE